MQITISEFDILLQLIKSEVLPKNVSNQSLTQQHLASAQHATPALVASDIRLDQGRKAAPVGEPTDRLYGIIQALLYQLLIKLRVFVPQNKPLVKEINH